MSLGRDLVDLWLRPGQAVERIKQQRTTRDALVAAALALLLPALVEEAEGLAPFRPPGQLPAVSLAGTVLDLLARWSYAQRMVLPLAGVIGGILLWAGAAALIHGAARALGGRGSLSGFLKFVGFAALAGLVTLPLAVLELAARVLNPQAADSLGPSLAALGLGVIAWQNLLLVLAAQVHYQVSSGKAVTAVLGPVIALLAAVFVLVVAVTTLFLLGAHRAGW